MPYYKNWIIGMCWVVLCLPGPIWADSADIVPGELVVKLSPSKEYTIGVQSGSESKFYALCKQTGAQKIDVVVSKTSIHSQSLSAPHFYRIRYSESANITDLVKQFSQLPGVQYAEPVRYVQANQTASDLIELGKTDLALIRNIPNHASVIVAVVDSGVDYTHPDLAGQMVINDNDPIDGLDNDKNGYVDDYYGYNFDGDGSTPAQRDPSDQFGHGTHIAGIIASKANGLYPGVNPEAKLLNVRFLDDRGRGTDAAGAEAIYYAVDRGSKVINCSWGYFSPSQTLSDAIAYAKNRGVVVVAASGNDNSLNSEYPAAFDSVFAIGSVNSDKSRSSFSNYGAYLDFMAFGRRVMGLRPGARYQSLSGTSQSTAVMSGIISRILAYDSTYSPALIYDMLKSSCLDIDRPGKDILTGNGVVDPARLVTLVTAGHSENNNLAGDVATENSVPVGVFSVPFTVSRVMNFPNPVRGSANQFGLETSDSADVRIDIYSPSGRRVKQIYGAVSEGYSAIPWTTTDDSGAALANGTYYYLVTVSGAGQMIRKKGMLSIVR